MLRCDWMKPADCFAVLFEYFEEGDWEGGEK